MTIRSQPIYDWANIALSYEQSLPTMYDLPSENPEEPGVPDMFHPWQTQLLSETFEPPDYAPEHRIAASDLNLYYDMRHTRFYKRPDWYAVVGIDHLYDKHDIRLSYVIWDEKIIPSIVVELLSPSTKQEDLGHTIRQSNEPPTKWEVYEQILGIPYYVVFDRYTDELRVFQLKGNRYYEQDLVDKRLWFKELKLGLGLWHGTYCHLECFWLRWYDAAGEWIPTPAEKEKKRAEMAEQRAEMEKAQKESIQKQIEKERERTQRLLAQLNALGIEPDK